MGNCLKSPTADDVSLLRDGPATHSNSNEHMGDQVGGHGGSYDQASWIKIIYPLCTRTLTHTRKILIIILDRPVGSQSSSCAREMFINIWGAVATRTVGSNPSPLCIFRPPPPPLPKQLVTELYYTLVLS